MSGRPHRHLVVVTLMPRGDDSGVARHTEILVASAAGWGFASASVAEPWSSGRALRAVFRVLSAVALVLPLADRATRAGRARAIRRLGLEAAVTWSAARRLVHGPGRRVVVAQDPTSAVAVLRLRRLLRIDRIVMTAHFNGSEWEEHAARGSGAPGDPIARILVRRERRAVHGAAKVIVPSEDSARQLRPRHPDVPRDRIVVAPHGVPLAPPAGTDALPDGPADLITIGTLEPRKGHRFLLDVVERCHALGHPLTLTVVGDGELRSELEERAAPLGGAVRFVGRVVPGAGLIPGHRMYVHGAETESFGLAVAEALGFGVPVAAGAVGAIPELVDDGVHGVLWPLDDPETAAARLVALLDDHEAWSAASRAARQRYEERYDPDVALERWRQLVTGGR